MRSKRDGKKKRKKNCTSINLCLSVNHGKKALFLNQHTHTDGVHRHHTWSCVKSFTLCNILLGYGVALCSLKSDKCVLISGLGTIYPWIPHLLNPLQSFLTPTLLCVFLIHAYDLLFCFRQREYSQCPWHCKNHLVWTTQVPTCGEIQSSWFHINIQCLNEYMEN